MILTSNTFYVEYFILVADDFDQNPFGPASVEFSVEYLLPGAKIELPFGHGHYHFPSHYRSFEVGIAIVLTGAIVPIQTQRFVGSQLFQPAIKILMQTALIVVDKNRGRDVHGIDQAEPLSNGTFGQTSDNLGRNVDKSTTTGNVEPQFISIRFHNSPFGLWAQKKGSAASAQLRAGANNFVSGGRRLLPL